MNIFITGGAGFIGSHLAEFHLKRGDQVVVLDDLTTGNSQNIRPFMANPHYRFEKGDVLNWEGLQGAVAAADRTTSPVRRQRCGRCYALAASFSRRACA